MRLSKQKIKETGVVLCILAIIAALFLFMPDFVWVLLCKTMLVILFILFAVIIFLFGEFFEEDERDRYAL